MDARLAVVETKVEHLGKQVNDLADDHADTVKDVDSLKAWRIWMLGMASGISAASAGGVLALLQRLGKG